MTRPHPIAKAALALLTPHADAQRGAGMAAYMRTTQPYLGVNEPNRRPIYRTLAREFEPADAAELRVQVRALWDAGRKGSCPVKPLAGQARAFKPRPGSKLLPPTGTGPRELQYCAIAHLDAAKAMVTPALLPFVKALIVEGGWWDTVDWIAMRIVSPMHATHRTRVAPVMTRWLADKNLWVRRVAILSQLTHKAQTDEAMLFRFALDRAAETDFFMRKAIGWALRHHARTNPGGVTAFVRKHRGRLSTLSVREAAKHLTL